MQLICDPANKTIIDSLFGDSTKSFAPPIAGEVVPYAVALVDRLATSVNGRQWSPRDITGATVKVIINNILPADAGFFTITFTANDLTTETTALIAFDADAATVSTALNAGAKMTAAGGCVVSGQDGYFLVTFNVVGDRHLLIINKNGLAPACLAEVGTLVEGDADKPEVQEFRIVQDAAAGATLTELSYLPNESLAVVAVVVDVLQVGDATHNHKIRVTFPNTTYDGSWTLTIGGDESDFLDFDIKEEDLLPLIEDLASVGTGNVSVRKEELGSYILMFTGAKANTDMGVITGDASALKALLHMRGQVDLRTAAMGLILGNEASANLLFELEVTEAGGQPQKVYQSDIVVKNTALPPDSLLVNNSLAAPDPVGEDYLPTVTGYVGGTGSDFDSVVTSGVLEAGALRSFVSATDGLVSYQLTSSSDATSSPDKIRPLDYNPAHPLVWFRVS